ncbi:MAG: chemotaxis protein CheB, partial [Pseudomonadota bacterium]
MFEDGLVESSSGLRKPPGKVASCPVVGVGASAGGLEAFQEFLAVAEPGDGLCYVLIQHLDPNHDSLLGELLGRRAKLDVVVVKSGMEVKADTIFLIPPGSEMTIENGLLQLDPFEEPRGLRRPIDEFFRTLAEDQRSNSACVVLSGTGSDGTHGLRAVKTAGGLTLVQDPDEAKYSGMPNSALATGLVDADMNARDMIAVLKRFFSGDEKMSFGDSGTGSQDYLREVLDIVGRRTGHDFSNYKKNTLLRRLQRRLQIVNVQDTAAYLRLLEQSESEPDELFSDMLINVTRFFRDPEHFNTLRTEVLGPMLDGRKTGEKVRVWCPGCSSGEEPYTIAMLLKEEASRRGINPEFQIFATD